MVKNERMTKEDYNNLDVAFATARIDQAKNEQALIALINLRAKVTENLKDYDAYLTELEKPKIKPEE